ncbi:MAG TPA: ankyrin repeat domain-containing protein [Candidatus Hydrogenedentes bacterium]|nr:ankyrin repeat domain-containing protein [Candidatus Hydrogenedentota bacterium]HNT89656.1 ankyrin repeat domain-containing protein [Candidatus Hydrogenedentota bacterium]
MVAEWMHTLDDAGRTPLDRAYSSRYMGIAEMILRLENEGAESNVKSMSPLHRAALLGLTDAVRSLVHYGADVDAPDSLGETPLHKAAREGHLAVVRELAALADVNIKSNMGMTPLHWAALTGRTNVAAVLLANGADPGIHNDVLDGMRPVEVAEVMGHIELAACLETRAALVA